MCNVWCMLLSKLVASVFTVASDQGMLLVSLKHLNGITLSFFLAVTLASEASLLTFCLALTAVAPSH